MPPLTSLQLRRLWLRKLTSSSSCFCSSIVKPHVSYPSLEPFRLASHVRHVHFQYVSNPSFLSLPGLSLSLSLSRNFSTGEFRDEVEVAQSISRELTIDPGSEPLSVLERLKLGFSHVTPTPSLVLATLSRSPEAGRPVLGFNEWLVSSPRFVHSDETISFFVDYLGRRKDFKAIHDVIAVHGRGVAGPKTLASAVSRLVRAGRATQAVAFFERMERDYGLERNKESLRLVVETLCEHGYASCAEKMVKNLANEFFPDEHICDLLIKAWCVGGKLDEARRLAGEIYRGGFELGVVAFNAMLDCVCKLCREKDPFRLQLEAENVLVDMDTHGVPRNVETFNVLINNLCKIRRTEEAMSLFQRMGEWGCYPNEETFLILIKSLYQAARVGEGDEMIDRMKSAGYGDKLDRKAYYGFLKVLCGIERVDHALSVFEMMKKDGCEPGVKTYDLLMRKVCGYGRVDKANALFSDAQKRGVLVTQKEYPVDPRYAKLKREAKAMRAAKKEKKRETLPEKMARKRRRLKQIHLSFVKKPKKGIRQAF